MMHTMSFDQLEMLELVEKVLDFTLATQTESFDQLTTKKVGKLLLASQKATALAQFWHDCALISTSQSSTVYFFSTTITIQDGRLPLIKLKIQVTSPEQHELFELSSATLSFIKNYLLEKRIIPNPFDIA